MLVSMTEMLKQAKKEKYAVGQFNINNLEFVQAILKAARDEKSPVICGLSKGAMNYMGGFHTAVHIVKEAINNQTEKPLVLHGGIWLKSQRTPICSY